MQPFRRSAFPPKLPFILGVVECFSGKWAGVGGAVIFSYPPIIIGVLSLIFWSIIFVKIDI